MKEKKISITEKQLQDILGTQADLTQRELDDIMSRANSLSEPMPHWLIVTLKIIAYALGLVLAGYGTTASATTLFF